MKIIIDKIVDNSVEILEYYGDDIFSFTLKNQNLLDEKIEVFKREFYKKESSIKKSLEKEVSKNDYDQIGSIEQLMLKT